MAATSDFTSLDYIVRNTPGLWRGYTHDKINRNQSEKSSETGLNDLDRFLPTGGWPLGALTELLVDRWGNGEWQILTPILSRLSQASSPVVLVNPPYLPYAPALEAAGIKLEQVIILDKRVSNDNLWWAAERILRHPKCGAVLMWPKHMDSRQVRRLQLAASTSHNLGFLLRQGESMETTVPLRLKLKRHTDFLTIRILKSRFGWQQGTTLTITC